MKKLTKVLAACDGSMASMVVMDDLRRAGLGRNVELLILTAADVWLPAGGKALDSTTAAVFPGITKARALAAKVLGEAQAVARAAAESASEGFPGWRIESEAVADSPAWAIVKRARAIKADLVVVGSHNKSAWQRFTLGSVSQKVLAEAPCSVRIARARPAGRSGAPRLLIGMDGSPHAEAALNVILNRRWQSGAEARVAVAMDGRFLTEAAVRIAPLKTWVRRGDASEEAWVHRMAEAAAGRLKKAGLAGTVKVARMDSKELLTKEAEAWKADCLFVGARGLTPWEKSVLGSTSLALAGRAPCTVEVVRIGV